VTLALTSTLAVPGRLHMVANAVKDMLYVMSKFESEVHPLLDALTCFLHNQWSRERYVASCLSRGVAQAWVPLFSSFPHTLVGWRWDAVCKVVDALLELQAVIQQTWDTDRIHAAVFGECEAPAQEANNLGPTFAKANEAVLSHMFWAYVKMISFLSNICGHIRCWFESCSCHGHLSLSSVQMKPHQVAFPDRLRKISTSCPLAGRRSPELAVGDLDKFIDDLVSIRLVDVLSCCADLQPAEVGTVIADFDAARNYVVGGVVQKMSVWKKLPHVLCGIGHCQEDKARAAAISALQQWHALTDAEAATAHPMSRKWCHPASHLCQQLVLFVRGASRADVRLHDMYMETARMALIPVSERAAEGPHSVIHGKLKKASASGASSISLALRLPQLTRTIESSPVALKMLVKLMPLVYHPLRAAQTLGIQGHPDVAPFLERLLVEQAAGEYMQLLGSTHKATKVVKRIIYHLDLRSRFVDVLLDDKPAPHQSATVPVPQIVRSGTHVEQLKDKLALAAFRAKLKGFSASTFFSLPIADERCEAEPNAGLSFLTDVCGARIGGTERQPAEDQEPERPWSLMVFDFDEGPWSAQPKAAPESLDLRVMMLKVVSASPSLKSLVKQDTIVPTAE